MAHDRYTIDQLLQLTRKNWPAADAPMHEFAMTLGRLMEATARAHGKFASARRLSPVEFDVLATLRKAAPPYEMTPTELQQAVVITSGGLTKVLYQLEARNLVGRSVDADDRRSKRVRLTRAGKTLIERAMAAMLASQAEALSDLSARELQQLTRLLRRALEAMESRRNATGTEKKRMAKTSSCECERRTRFASPATRSASLPLPDSDPPDQQHNPDSR